MRVNPTPSIATELTERIMAEITRASVLQPDEPYYPYNYNRTWSIVYEILHKELVYKREEEIRPYFESAKKAGLPAWLRRTIDQAQEAGT